MMLYRILNFQSMNEGSYFNMSIKRTYMYIFQPQLCMSKSMAVQIIDLRRLNKKDTTYIKYYTDIRCLANTCNTYVHMLKKNI